MSVVLGPYHTAVAVAAQELGLTYLVLEPLKPCGFLPSDNLYEMAPHHSLLDMIAVDLATAYHWENVLIIYDSEEGKA